MTDRRLFFFTTTLIMMSIIIDYSLTTYVVVLFDYNATHFLLRQSIFAALSIGTIWLLSRLEPTIWVKRIGITIFLLSLLLMISMPFMPDSLVTEVGGAKRWIRLFGFSLAPVEFFKIGFVYFLAWSFSRKLTAHNNMGLKAELQRFLPYAVVFIIVMFIIAIMQNDIGQVFVLAMTLMLLSILAGSSFKFFLLLIFTVLLLIISFIFTSDHRILRVISWWSIAQNSILSFLPEFLASHLRVESYSEPYQISHSLNAIYNGSLFGVGLGNGTFKLGFLSEVHTDFVLAGIAEEFGFLGVLLVTLLFFLILHRIIKIANRSHNRTFFLFSAGIAILMAFSFILNAYGISGVTPIKGIAVPFLSYGGSSMLANSIAIGMILMISKKVDLK